MEATYPTDQAVQEDQKLIGFHASLADPGQGNIPGFPASPGSRQQLTSTLTSIIFTASVQHHALNSPQHHYSYAPHRPTLLTKWMPDGEDDISWAWIKEALPKLPLVEDMFTLSNLLSTHSLCSLSKLDEFSSDLPNIQSNLKEELATISREVRARGGEYDYLDPDIIACSIDI